MPLIPVHMRAVPEGAKAGLMDTTKGKKSLATVHAVHTRLTGNGYAQALKEELGVDHSMFSQKQ